MTTLNLIQFSGEIPRLLPRLLPDTAAQRAYNVRLEDGGLTPIRQKRLDHVVDTLDAGDIQTIYKNGDEWLAWSTIVNAAPGPVATDRLYFTGDGVPKMRVDGVTYPLAVPQPTGSLTGSISGTGTGNTTTLIYVWTWVTQWGEESEPSAASNYIDWQAGQTVTLTGFTAAPAGRGITKQRIYRTQSGNSTSGLYFIAERDASASDYADVVDLAASQEPIPSINWNAPPDTLAGLIALPNGMMAAFNGKDLMFCEPWRPHAWPEDYALTADYPIVALGSYGTTVVVLTTGKPYIVDGTSPDSMQMQRIDENQPCINARAVVDLGYSVAYPSHDGLVTVSSSGVSVVSNQLFTRNDWQQLQPALIVAAQYDGSYFMSYEYTNPVGEFLAGSLMLDLTGQTPFVRRSTLHADAFHYDLPNGALYLLIGNEIYEWDALGQANETLTWRSKQFVMPKPCNFGAIRIDASTARSPEDEAAYQEYLSDVQTSNAAIFATAMLGGAIGEAAIGLYSVAGDALERDDSPAFVSAAVYADGELVAKISKLNQAKRLPAGFTARVWEVEISTNTQLSQIGIAENAKELALI